MNGRAAMMSMLLALSACSVGPEYRRPALDVPGAYRFQSETPGAESIADMGWWEIYRDAHLQALLRTALDNNIDAKIAAARVSEARALVGASDQGRLPQVSAGLGDTRQHSLLFGQYATFEVASAQASVSYEADIWRRMASLSDAARAGLLASEYARDAVRVALIGDVASAYFSLQALDLQLDITEGTIVNGETFVALTRRRHLLGAASTLEVSRAEAALASVQAGRSDIQRQIAQNENQLRILLGKNPDGIARGRLDEAPMALSIPAGLPATLLERRPDLREAEEGLAGAVADVRAAKAALFPTISLTGSYGSQSTALSGLFGASTHAWSYGLGFLQPVIDAQRNGYRLDAARMREAQALLRYQGTVAQAFREVSDALIAAHSYSEQLRVQQQQVQSLQLANSQVLRRYESGYSSYFEVIDASNSLYAAQLQRLQACRNARVSLVQLYKALGGGWKSARPDALP